MLDAFEQGSSSMGEWGRNFYCEFKLWSKLLFGRGGGGVYSILYPSNFIGSSRCM